MSNYRVIHFKTDGGDVGIEHIDNYFSHHIYGYRVYDDREPDTSFPIYDDELKARKHIDTIKNNTLRRGENVYSNINPKKQSTKGG